LERGKGGGSKEIQNSKESKGRIGGKGGKRPANVSRRKAN